MQLILKRGNLTLATGTSWADGVVTGELPTEVKRWMEVLPMLGASGVSAFDYLTRQIDSEFTITKEHASASDALIFAKTHEALATGKASLTLEWTEDSVTYRLRSAGCAWQALSVNLEGVTTDVVYRVQGPPFTASSSEGPEGNYVDGGDGYDAEYGPVPGVLDGGHYGDNGIPSALAVHSPNY